MNKRTEIRASLTKKQFVEKVIEYCDLRPWWNVECVDERAARFFVSTKETPTRYIWFEYERENLRVSISTECQGERSLHYYRTFGRFEEIDIVLLFDELHLN